MPEHRTDTAATPAPDDTLRERLAERASLLAVSKSEQAKIVDALLPLIREHVAAAVQGERERSASDRLVMAIFGTPSDGPQPFALISDDPKPRPFAYGVQWPGGTVTVKAIDGSVMGNVTSPSLEDHFNQYGKSAVVWLAEDLGTLADMEERAEKAEAVLRDIADHGLRADLNPTVPSLEHAESYGWWMNYLRRIDASVRQRARAALDGTEATP